MLIKDARLELVCRPQEAREVEKEDEVRLFMLCGEWCMHKNED